MLSMVGTAMALQDEVATVSIIDTPGGSGQLCGCRAVLAYYPDCDIRCSAWLRGMWMWT